MTKGVFLSLKIRRDSQVIGIVPAVTSITKIAISATAPPLFRKFKKAAWPGVSTTNIPGSFISFSANSCLDFLKNSLISPVGK